MPSKKQQVYHSKKRTVKMLIQVPLDSDLFDRVSAEASRRGISVGLYVRMALIGAIRPSSTNNPPPIP